MSTEQTGLSHHPAPSRHRVGAITLAFATIGAPFGWYLQLLVNYALLAMPCFNGPARLEHFPPGAGWTWPTALAVYLACLMLGVAATIVSLNLFRMTKSEDTAHDADFEESGSGRTRFLAYWGLLLGTNFTTVTAVNLLPMLVVPPCAT